MKELITKWLDYNKDITIRLIDKLCAGGRKMLVILWTEGLLAALGILQIVTLKTEPVLCYWMMAGVAGFFFGVNILGDHIFNNTSGQKDTIDAK